MHLDGAIDVLDPILARRLVDAHRSAAVEFADGGATRRVEVDVDLPPELGPRDSRRRRRRRRAHRLLLLELPLAVELREQPQMRRLHGR